MRWKHKTVREVSGITLSNATRQLAISINHNAEVLREAVQKIEELSKEIDRLKGGGKYEN